MHPINIKIAPIFLISDDLEMYVTIPDIPGLDRLKIIFRIQNSSPEVW